MTTVLHGGMVFDGSGTDPERADVAFDGGRIVAVGEDLPGGQRVDVTGKTLLPGLFDCHVHVMVSSHDVVSRLEEPFSYAFYVAAKNLSALLDCGITTARDAGGADLGVKRAVDDGLIEGPRLKIAITMMSQTGGHGDAWRVPGTEVKLAMPHPGRPSPVADGVEGVRLKVREIARAGADVIKVCTTGGVLSPRDSPAHSQYSAEEVAAIVAEAASTDLAVMAHAQSPRGIRNAILAGVRSVEHGIYLDEATLELMLAHDVWLVPTLVAPHAVIKMADAGVRISPAAVEKAKAVADTHMASFARAVAAGVKVAMGTDTGVGVFGDNLDELPLMAAAGMRPAQVLAATTSCAAQLLGVADESGTIEPGKRADIVVVDGDPYRLGELKSAIGAVYQDGVRVRS